MNPDIQINAAVAQLFTQQLASLRFTGEITVEIQRGVSRFVRIGKTVIMADGEQRLCLVPALSYGKVSDGHTTEVP